MGPYRDKVVGVFVRFRAPFISRVGRDSFGENLMAFMDEQGIDRRCL
jgi:sugar/nucleoside kinase (ribokinase family)